MTTTRKADRDDMALRAICLCDGYGGFELGLRLAGVDVRTVARVERDSYAAAVLVARMEEAHLDQAPIWDDLTTFDGGAWSGRVDLVTAGFPCQPFSSAGEQLGTDDERWLWPDIARIVADVRPRFVFLENVPGLVRLGLPDVLADLAEMGFDAEWGSLAASAVGAPHRRERIWILAHANGGGLETVGEQSRGVGEGLERDADRRESHVADPDDLGIGGQRDAIGRPSRRTEAARSGAHVADAEDDRRTRPQLPQRPGAQLARTQRSHSWPPHPDDLDGWERYLAEGGPEPSIRRGPDGRPSWLADALHLGGNGLVPLAAGHAFRQLVNRFDVREES